MTGDDDLVNTPDTREVKARNASEKGVLLQPTEKDKKNGDNDEGSDNTEKRHQEEGMETDEQHNEPGTKNESVEDKEEEPAVLDEENRETLSNYNGGDRNREANFSSRWSQEPDDRSGFDTEEDEVNTITSGKTTVHLTAEEMAAVQELPSIRYNFSFVLEELSLEVIKEDFEGHNIPEDLLNTTATIHKVLKALYGKLRTLDKNAVLLSWRSDGEGGTKYFDKEEAEFPKDGVGMREYFDGINLRRKVGRIYLRFRFHSINQESTYQSLKLWSDTNGYRMAPCIVQAVSSIVYTSDYTDIDFIKKQVKRIGNVEVGLKVSAITTSDIWEDEEKGKKTEWRDRIKALSVHAATEDAQIATAVISTMLEPKTIFSKELQNNKWTSRYLFTQQEYTIPKDKRLNYRKLVNRQDQHLKNLCAFPSQDILVDIDYRLITEDWYRKTMRDMILDIKSSDTTISRNRCLLRGRRVMVQQD